MLDGLEEDKFREVVAILQDSNWVTLNAVKSWVDGQDKAYRKLFTPPPSFSKTSGAKE